MTFLALLNRLPPADQSLANDAADAQLTTVAILAAKRIDRYVHDKHPRIVELFDESEHFSPRTLREIIGSDSPPIPALAEDNCWFGIWWKTLEAIRLRFPDRFASSESLGGRKTTKDVLLGQARIGTLIQNPPNRWRDRAFDFKTTLGILGELVGETKGAASSAAGLENPATRNPVQWAGTNRGIFAVVFTDIVDSTGLRFRAGDSFSTPVIEKHITRSQQLILQHNGCFVKSTGDGILAIFRTAAEALAFSLVIVRDTGDLLIELRAGIHVGEVNLSAVDIQGSTVDMTRRVQENAAGSQIMVTDRAYEDILRAGLTGHRDLLWTHEDERDLKGIGPEKLWSISVADLSVSGH